MEKENIYIWMELCMKEIGLKINSMATEKKNGLIQPNMKGNMNKAKKMEKENLLGLMVLPMKDNFSMILFKEMVFTNGQI